MNDDPTLTTRQLRVLRRKLAAEQITPEEAAEQGFPPEDPIKETR